MTQMYVYEGTWEEVAEHAAELRGRRVRVTIVSDEKPFDLATPQEQPAGKGHLYFGMFKGEPEVTEEDFKLA